MPQLGFDCGLGTTQAVVNATFFPVASSETGTMGNKAQCNWIGDVGASGQPPAPADTTTEPLVSDQDETYSVVSPKIGGGFTADIVYLQTATSTINGFDLAVTWNPAVLRGIAFDQGGLGPFGTGNPFTAISTIDNTAGRAELGQVILGSPLGGDFILFRIRFDVVGVGNTALTLIDISGGITNPGVVPHTIVQGNFNSNSFFDPAGLLNWSVSWTNSTPIVPGSAITFQATATCPGCTGTLTYSWDVNSDGISDATGNPASITIPTSTLTAHRVTLTVTDGAAHSATATHRLSLAAVVQGPQGTNTIPVNTSQTWTGLWLGGISPYTGSWRFCPGVGIVPPANAICAKPSANLASSPSQTSVQLLNAATAPTGAYHLGGVYTNTLKITDTASASVGPTATTVSVTFLVNVTGAPFAYTVSLASSSATPAPGTSVTFTANLAYDATFPAAFRSTAFSYKFFFGDGGSQVVAGALTATASHTYLAAGSFTALVVAQETSAVAVSAIQETSNRIVETVSSGVTPPSVTVTCPATGTVGIAIACTAAGSAVTTPYTFAWTATGGTPSSGAGASFSTTYNVKGSKTISVILTDSETPAKTATASATVTIAALALGVTAVGPTTGNLNTPLVFTATATGGTTPYTFAWTATGGTPSSGTGTALQHNTRQQEPTPSVSQLPMRMR
jgi:hypothetical protein